MRWDSVHRLQRWGVSFILLVTVALCLVSLSSAAVEQGDKKTAATVNGATITEADVSTTIDKLIPKITYHGSISEEKKGEFRDKALAILIEYELKYQSAVAEGMKPDKKAVTKAWDAVRDQFPSKKEYKKSLEQAGLTEDTWKARIEKRVLVDQMTKKVVDDPSRMTDDAVKQYYEKNINKFQQPESVRFRYIIVKEEKKIREAYDLIKGGQDFGMTATRMSEDDYRVKGGDRGIVHKGGMVPEMENVIFAMKVGDMAGPFQAGGKWLLVKLEDKKPGRQVSYEETKERLKVELESKRREELMDQWVADLRSRAKIVIYTNAL